jgi:hypothetical protein
VHTTVFPDGEIRGQLVAAKEAGQAQTGSGDAILVYAQGVTHEKPQAEQAGSR